MVRTIVIFHPGGLGDLLLAVPAIRRLRERYPDHDFLLCGHAQIAEVLGECHLIDRWLSVTTTACAALFAGAAPDDSTLRDWLSRCDLAVAWTNDDSGLLTATLKTCGAAAAIVQSPFASTLKSVHQSERCLEIVGEQTAPVFPAALSIPNTLRVEAEAYLRGCGLADQRSLALVHPGSGSRHKCVKPASLLAVLEGLEAQGVKPVLLEGPADYEMVERLLRQRSAPATVLRALSVRLLAGVLSRVDLFLGHDSGVAHLSALVGTPTVAMFGPTDPARWAPRGPAVTVIRKRPCDCASWDAVKNCGEKPCLELSAEAIVAACLSTGAIPITPRIC